MIHATFRLVGVFVVGLICAVGITNVAFAQADAASGRNKIKINQVGFLPNSPKIALLDRNISGYYIVDSLHRLVNKGSSLSVKYWPYSGDSVRIADFSSLCKEGKYWLISTDDSSVKQMFTISSRAYRALSCASLKAFYYNRASVGISKEFGGRWCRIMGHPDDSVLIHSSAASASRPEGTSISSPKGWYDAGDYNKYVVNSGITGYMLLLAYQLAPEYYRNLTIGIPESGNGMPDILNELIWNIRWMLTMQDPADGGVYHKLTNKGFDGFVMPDKATNTRYVVQKTTAATLDFAALMASCYRTFKNYGQLKELADSCLSAGKKAWKWAEQNPSTVYKQPSDIVTGEYGDSNLDDEWSWAATELALATKDKSFLRKLSLNDVPLKVPTWNNVGMLAVYTLLTGGKDFDTGLYEQAGKKVVELANMLLNKQKESAYGVSIDYFDWGSNSDVAQQGILKRLASMYTKNDAYMKSAYADLDYLLGRNAVGYCFVTGFGQQSPMHIHHRPSAADGVLEPVPGFLVGGPNLIVPTDCSLSPTRNIIYPAKSYEDSECSYSTNEIAINWNASLVCLVGLLDCIIKID